MISKFDLVGGHGFEPPLFTWYDMEHNVYSESKSCNLKLVGKLAVQQIHLINAVQRENVSLLQFWACDQHGHFLKSIADIQMLTTYFISN